MPEPFSLPRPEPLRAILPSLRDISAFLDTEAEIARRRRGGSTEQGAFVFATRAPSPRW